MNAEPGVMRCPLCRGAQTLPGPRVCDCCDGRGIIPADNVIPLRPRGLRKARIATEYRPGRDGVEISRDGTQYRLAHQRGGRAFEVWISREELRELVRQGTTYLEDDDGKRKR